MDVLRLVIEREDSRRTLRSLAGETWRMVMAFTEVRTGEESDFQGKLVKYLWRHLNGDILSWEL